MTSESLVLTSDTLIDPDVTSPCFSNAFCSASAVSASSFWLPPGNWFPWGDTHWMVNGLVELAFASGLTTTICDSAYEPPP